MTEFIYESELQVRFRDLDPLGHVNNAVYASYCEQARIEFFQEVFDIEEVNTVLANIEIDYRRPIDDLDVVTVALDVTDIGDSSFEMSYELRFDGEVAATASTVLVVLDPETEKPTRVPDEWREAVAELRG